MKTSLRAVNFIKTEEGIRLTAYRDVAGVWTIGWGHTSDKLYPVRRGMKITKAEAEAMLRHDISEAEMAINSSVRVPLNGDQYGALVSFVFNVGVGAFRGSSLLREINRGRTNLTHEFGLWVKGGNPKRTIPDLVRRRAEEAALFSSGGKADTTKKPQRGEISATGTGDLAVASGGLTTTAGPVAEVLRDQTDQLTGLSYYTQSSLVTYMIIGLTLLGMGLTVYGLWTKYKRGA